MPNWNPNAPEVLGNEWLANVGLTQRVWAGTHAGMARMPSTAAETIIQLQMSATVNPLLSESAPTVVDVIEEGQEQVGLFKLASLIPNSDTLNEGWTTGALTTTNLYQKIDEDVTRWPKQIAADWIQTTQSYVDYECSFDTASFAAGGANQNARIGWVAVQTIYDTNTGFRKLYTTLNLAGNYYSPAGGWLRDANSFGSIFKFWWGEINPATGLPWIPADIANFGPAGTYRFRVGSHQANTNQFPIVHGVRLHVHYQTVENRAAVGVWRRPEDIPDRLTTAATTNLRTLPSAGPPTGRNSPAATTCSCGDSRCPPPSTGPSSRTTSAGTTSANTWVPEVNLPTMRRRPVGCWQRTVSLTTSSGGPNTVSCPTARRALRWSWFAPTSARRSIRSPTGLISPTSRKSPPHRSSGSGSHRPHPSRISVSGSSIIPPATGTPTLTVTVNRVSDSVQMGGTFTITAAACRALPAGVGGWRYVTGFLSSGAALVSGTAYEIRFTTRAGGNWMMAMPDSSLGAAASYGGTTNGAFIGATHITTRDLSANLVRQPDPPTNVQAGDRQHRRHHLLRRGHHRPSRQRDMDAAGGRDGRPVRPLRARTSTRSLGRGRTIAKITTSADHQFHDHEAPRNVAATYRIRAVGTDGRFSDGPPVGAVTCTDPRAMLILTSNHSNTCTSCTCTRSPTPPTPKPSTRCSRRPRRNGGDPRRRLSGRVHGSRRPRHRLAHTGITSTRTRWPPKAARHEFAALTGHRPVTRHPLRVCPGPSRHPHLRPRHRHRSASTTQPDTGTPPN